MHIIKLSAIASTNDYLKELNTRQLVENFTVVVAENQTNGKGQRGTNWNTETGKNLTFSVLTKNILLNYEEIFHLNVIVAVAVFQTLEDLKIPEIKIKWANDILSEKKKICGILIENQIKSASEIISIIGIGLNINQENFENLPHASSLKKITGNEWNKEAILISLLAKLQQNINRYKNEGATFFWETYHKNLFKKDIPTAFEGKNGEKFMGIIRKVTPNGLLQIELEDDSLQLFDIKEVKMLF